MSHPVVEMLVNRAQMFKTVYSCVHAQKQENPQDSQSIQYPKISEHFSEPLLLHLLLENKVQLENLVFDEVRLGGKQGDLLAIRGDKTLRVEVKATGSVGWISMSEKDFSADFFVWFLYIDGPENLLDNRCLLITCPTPKNFLNVKNKLTYQELLKQGNGFCHVLDTTVRTLLETTQPIHIC